MFKCYLCSEEFETATELRSHKMTHTKEDREKREPKGRQKRVPLGTPQLKLTADIPPGKVGHWVNDKPGRVQAAQNGGYELVKDRNGVSVGEDDGNSDIGGMASRVVGTNEAGQPMKAYLMVIDEDLYNEDQKMKQTEIDKVDQAIKEGSFENKSSRKHLYGEIQVSANNSAP